jgi:glycine oxidase
MTTASFLGKNYAIVGAGLMGRLLAVALAQRGAQVDLFEKDDSSGLGSAAWAAAAMLAPLAESAITEDSVVRMGIYSLARWQQIIAELQSPVYFQQQGTLVLWHHQDAKNAERFAAHLIKNAVNHPNLVPPEPLDQVALRTLEPAIAERFTQGLYLPNEGQLDNRQLLQALQTELDLLQVKCHWHTPIEPELLRKEKKYAWVIDCRGLGAKGTWHANNVLSNQTNHRNPLRGIRGEVIRLYAPEVKLQRPTRLIHPRYPIYIAPKQEDIYVVGATEVESEDMSAMSVRSAMELLSATYSIHSGFAEARILDMTTQCRPTLKDNLPEIRLKQGFHDAGLMMINGLYRHGFMISPAILDCALEILEQGESDMAMTFNLSVQYDEAIKDSALCVSL